MNSIIFSPQNKLNLITVNNMATTIELLALRIEILEKKISSLAIIKPDPKAKRVTGYLMHNSAYRADVKARLQAESEHPIKATQITKELATRWKALSIQEREEWNKKAKDLKEAPKWLNDASYAISYNPKSTQQQPDALEAEPVEADAEEAVEADAEEAVEAEEDVEEEAEEEAEAEESVEVELEYEEIEVEVVQDEPPETEEKVEKKEKKEKKEKEEKEEKEVKKRKSGYILFQKIMRDDVISELSEALNTNEKVKPSQVMSELGKMWKALDDNERDEWNSRAAEQN